MDRPTDLTFSNLSQAFLYPFIWFLIGSFIISFLFFFLKRLLSKHVLLLKRRWFNYYSEKNLTSPHFLHISEKDLTRRLDRRDMRLLQDMRQEETFFLELSWRENIFAKRIRLILSSLRWLFFTSLLILFLKHGSKILVNLGAFLEDQNQIFINAKLIGKIGFFLSQVQYYVMKILFIFMGLVWFSKLIHEIIHMVLRRTLHDHEDPRAKVRAETLEVVAVYVSNILVFFLILIFTLRLFDVQMEALLATAGVASFSLGFAAQPLVRDFLSGFLFIIEDQFAVGDVVKIDDKHGVVESLTLRITRLRGTEGTVFVIPNGEVRVVENMTSGWSRIDFKLTVDLNSQVQQVLKIMNEECYKLYLNFRDIVLEPPSILGVDAVDLQGIVIRAFIKTAPGEQWALRRELNLRLLERLHQDNLELPRQQVETWIKSV